MKRLLITTHHLNETYLKLDTFDDIYLLEIKPFFKAFTYHKQRILLHLSASRHFFEEYKHTYPITYLKVDSIEDLLQFNDENTVLVESTDRHMSNFFKPLTKINKLKDPHFLSNIDEVSKWKKGASYKMDHFYRFMRHKYDILMENNKPVLGKYSFDTENRKTYKKGLIFSPHMTYVFDDITRDAIREIEHEYKDHIGSVESFQYPVTRIEALAQLEHAMHYHLHTFGDYQDVMIKGDPKLSHTLLSSSINIGLLSPYEVIKKAEDMYHAGLASIESTEGFIRQILGWREYMNIIYQLTPDYHDKNYFHHLKELPSLFWDAKTDVNCLKETITETIQYSYNHHIQRLMVLGNYANLIGVKPKALNDWFNTMYIDSFDFIVTPNVIGMALYADGGLMSTKPYISSAAYIHKMSNYCETCKYDPKIKEGPKACPFNALYWNFIDTHEDKLKDNPRMSMMVSTKRKMDKKVLETYKKDAKAHIEAVT